MMANKPKAHGAVKPDEAVDPKVLAEGPEANKKSEKKSSKK